MRQKVHHQTERGARIALARKQITQESYEATLRGELSLVQARELGREGVRRPARFAAVRGRPRRSRSFRRRGRGRAHLSLRVS